MNSLKIASYNLEKKKLNEENIFGKAEVNNANVIRRGGLI